MKLVAQSSTLDLSRPHVMNILSVTPDSSSDSGAHNLSVEVVEHTNLMINAGTTIIDIDGESTRPGATEVGVKEELVRMIPAVETIAQRFEVWISMDTSKSEVIRGSAQVGAYIINGIRLLTEPGALQATAKAGLLVCLIHMQGQPKTMQEASRYEDVFADVECFFAEHIMYCEQAGITKEKLLLNPGFGFGRNLSHNYQLLVRLGEFHHLGLPLLVGMSWKPMVDQLLNIGPSEWLDGNLACAVIVVVQGAQIIHVHDVRETVEALCMAEATLVAKGGKRYE